MSVLTLHSEAFAAGEPVPRRYSGDGEDLSPPLSWNEPPRDTREFALVVDDPDAPSPEPWVHWVITGVAADCRAIPEGVHPTPNPPFPLGAAQGLNSWGGLGYRGPAPPRGHGIHQYRFRLYALDAPLGLGPRYDKAAVMAAARGHVLAMAELVGTYERPARRE